MDNNRTMQSLIKVIFERKKAQHDLFFQLKININIDKMILESLRTQNNTALQEKKYDSHQK